MFLFIPVAAHSVQLPKNICSVRSCLPTPAFPWKWCLLFTIHPRFTSLDLFGVWRGTWTTC